MHILGRKEHSAATYQCQGPEAAHTCSVQRPAKRVLELGKVGDGGGGKMGTQEGEEEEDFSLKWYHGNGGGVQEGRDGGRFRLTAAIMSPLFLSCLPSPALCFQWPLKLWPSGE